MGRQKGAKKMNEKKTRKDAGEELGKESVDDFIKELEKKEKALEISSDVMIEVRGAGEESEQGLDTGFEALGEWEEELVDASVGEAGGFREQIARLEEKVAELQEAVKRRQRDLERYRERVEKERGDIFRKVASNVASQMLPVMDNLDRALEAFSEADREEEERNMETFYEGVILVSQQLSEVLADMGVEPILAMNKPFDPHLHEAVGRQESADKEAGTVIEEVLKGYRIEDRIIRPSMVKVSVAGSVPEEISIAEE